MTSPSSDLACPDLAPRRWPAAHDPRSPGFAKDGKWDASRPSAALAVALEASSGRPSSLRVPARPGQPDHHRGPPRRTGWTICRRRIIRHRRPAGLRQQPTARGRPARRIAVGLWQDRRYRTARWARQMDADPARRQEPRRGTRTSAHARPVITGMSRTPTSRTTGSVTWSRSATAPAPFRCAHGRRENPTLSMRSRMTRAAALAAATRAPAAGSATRSNSPRAGW